MTFLHHTPGTRFRPVSLDLSSLVAGVLIVLAVLIILAT
jgi:hypothetical protein